MAINRAALPVHRAVARARLTDLAGRVLIVKPRGANKQRWHLPGGKVEAVESPRAACFRELVEELGIHVEVGELLVSAWNPDPAMNEHDWLSYLFDCGRFDAGTLDGRILLNQHEVSDHRWVTMHVAMTMLEPGLARLLHAALEGVRYLEYLPWECSKSLAPGDARKAAGGR
jgi:8-oxo-dGTP pyrophosphatase MutT (NUDIX family)